ncbi:MAG: DinB family protein [Candidatus Nomurabacteria bacterium]|jgi:hypothetical protein|nr:DinB family protein [Candidatus Nomurabacteria bacterium]
MTGAEILADGFGRLPDLMKGVLDGASQELLDWAPDAAANHIGWLIWHLTRVMDNHISDLMKQPEIWRARKFDAKFGLDKMKNQIGYGHTADEVHRVRPRVELLQNYFDTVYARTMEFLRNLTDRDLDEIVDRAWDSPVTLGVRLVSVLCETHEHIAQAAYLGGVFRRTH